MKCNSMNFSPLKTELKSQSQTYFTTDGLPPISLSWQVPRGSPPEISFLQLNPCGNSPYVISLDETMGLSLMNRLCLCQMYVSRILYVIDNSWYCTIHKASLSTGFAKIIMPVLPILCYNGSLVTGTVVSLTAARLSLLLQNDFLLNNILEYSSYLTGNIVSTTKPSRLICWANSRCLLWEPHGTHKYSVSAECRVLICYSGWYIS
jgi:hypothetical protein